MIRQRAAARVPAWLGLAAIGMLAAACGDRVPGAAYDLSGIVQSELVEGSSPTPLGGAVVVFTSDTGRVTSTVSGDDGRYEMQVFTDVAFGQVRAEAAGFVPDERTVYFDVPARRIDLVLRPVVGEE